MAAFSVTATTSPCLLQRRRFFPPSSSSASTHHLQGSPLQNWKLGFFLDLRRKRRTLICAVNQDAKEAVTDTLQIDELKEEDPQYDGSGTFPKIHDKSMQVWSQFAKRVSGEWDGFGADFSIEGEPIELPESVVPEAYREWEVKVYDWQTQCPTLAEPADCVLEYKSIQLLPTVGCEADAATRYSIDERKVGGANSAVSAFAYQSSGSYIALWKKKDTLLELEYCLINPHDRESRVRIIQLINVLHNTKMVLQSIRVFCEQWYGPFRNGDQLGGCSIRDSAFASTAPLIAAEVTGIWQGSRAVATFGTSNTVGASICLYPYVFFHIWGFHVLMASLAFLLSIQLQEIFRELVDDDKVQNSVRDGDNNILLPKKLWCSLRQNKDGETLSEVGWLLDHGQTITSSSLFSSTAKLKEISIASETKAGDI